MTKQERTKALMDMGLTFDGQQFVYKDINFHHTDILCLSDDDFNTALTGARKRIDQLKLEENAAPDFLLEESEIGATQITDNTLATLSQLMKDFDDAKEAMESAEKIFKLKKEAFQRLEQERIPEFLLTHGMQKFQLTDGRNISIKEDISVTIKKENELKFREWLRTRGEDDILKINYSFARMAPTMIDALADFLLENDYEFDIKEEVHPQTKKKYFKELIKDIGRQNLPDWVGIYDIKKTVVK